jgi:uncharacterized protein with PIN domain
MSLNPLTLINQVIEEHGSSTIQAKHLAMLKDEITILQRKATELAAKVEELETENGQLRAKLKEQQPAPTPGDKCPYCNRHTGKLEEIKPHPEHMFAILGVKNGFYKCANPDCGKSYDKKMPK